MSFFDQPYQPQISGLLGGGYQQPGDYLPGPVNVPPPQAQPQHPGFFQHGGGWATALGILGDGLAGAGGGQPLYAKSLMEQKQHEQDLTALEQKRQKDWEDFQRQHQWVLDHTPPETPGIAKEVNWYGSLDPAQRSQADQYLGRVHPSPAPITMNQGDTIEGAGAPAAGGEITATNPQTGEKVRLNPQTGQWEPMGGAPASPAPTFP